MAKIINKASLIIGNNIKLHIADKGGVDIAITDNGDGTCTLVSTTTDFVSNSEASGIVNKPIEVGDRVTISNTSQSGNEGYQCDVTAVSSNSLTGSDVSGASVSESAGSDINVVAVKKTYQFIESNGLSFIDGVQGIVFASWIVDLWDSADLDKYASLFTSIEPRAKSMANKDGWEPHDNSTLNAIRDTALEIRPNATSAYIRAYAMLRSTGNCDEVTDQIHYWSVNDAEMTAPNIFVMTGYCNQLVLLHDIPNAIDNRGVWHTRCAEAGKTLVMESHDLQYAEIYPVSANNTIDPKLADPSTGIPYTSDSIISAGGIYANIKYYSDVDGVYPGDVDGNIYNFNGYIDGDSQSHVAIHEKTMYLMRQGININSDGTGASFRGDKQSHFCDFSGDVFTLQMYLLNYPSSERNNLRVVDSTDNVRQWPTIVGLTVNSPTLLVGGTFTIYHTNTFGTSGAVPLEDENSVQQQDVPITGSEGIVIAYSTYNVDGHAPNTPINCTLAFDRPGYVEPDITEFQIDGSNINVTLSPKSDPSYIV